MRILNRRRGEGTGGQRGPRMHHHEFMSCDGCIHFRHSMKSRSIRGPNEDYFDCDHPAVRVPIPDWRIKQLTEKGNPPAVLTYPKNIGSGSGHCRTPEWCPVTINKGRRAK